MIYNKKQITCVGILPLLFTSWYQRFIIFRWYLVIGTTGWEMKLRIASCEFSLLGFNLDLVLTLWWNLIFESQPAIPSCSNKFIIWVEPIEPIRPSLHYYIYILDLHVYHWIQSIHINGCSEKYHTICDSI